MLAFVHGYGLAGSGSNLWTAAVVRALCENGEDLHLVSQESKPERFDFVTEAYRHGADGRRELLFRRGSELAGRCVLHRPDLDVLPTYVRPQAASDYVVCILDLDDAALEGYLGRHVRLLERLVSEEGVTGFHVNHVVLLSEAARRVKDATGTPYAVTPHGSALEYVAKREERSRKLAEGALADAARVFALNGEIRGRLLDAFPAVSGLAGKVVPARVGVDTRRFRPVPRGERRDAVGRLKEAVADEPRGRGPEEEETLRRGIEEEVARLEGGEGSEPGGAEGAGAAPDRERLEALVGRAADYARQNPDADLEEKLDSVKWEEEPVVLFVGRLTAAKGFPALAAAFPAVLGARPDARLIVAGNGPGREWMEALHLAAARGRFDVAGTLAEGEATSGDAAAYPAVGSYLEALRARGGEAAYAAAAARVVEEGRVLHLGFLGHEALRHLYGCADVAVFPSLLVEVGPMVALEAAAAGCVPVGTYHAGMKDILDTLAPALPGALVPELRLRPDPEHVVGDIADAVSGLLGLDLTPFVEPLRERTVATYDWREVARLVGSELERMAGGGSP